ncbi:phage tail protein [Proteus vulgaris]|uniref:phage tail protein n=1 Tax=Proteus vulgaris TaxID=585 RepID=UPI00358DD101
MKKPANLRDTLIKKVAYLGENPDRLYTFIEWGRLWQRVQAVNLSINTISIYY